MLSICPWWEDPHSWRQKLEIFITITWNSLKLIIVFEIDRCSSLSGRRGIAVWFHSSDFFSVTGQWCVREATFLPETSARYGGCPEGHGQGELQRWFVWNNRQSCAYTAVLAAELTRVFKEVVDTWHCFNLCLRVGKASLRELPEQVLGCCSTWWSPAC